MDRREKVTELDKFDKEIIQHVAKFKFATGCRVNLKRTFEMGGDLGGGQRLTFQIVVEW